MSLENPTWIERRPMWQKAGTIILIVIASYVFVFWLGTQKAREWADSEYLQERDKRMAEIAVLEKSADDHAKNESILATENSRLKMQNEATAEILKANDAKIAGDAQKFVDLQKQRELKGDEIQNASGADSVAGLCADAKRAGFALSFCR